MSEITYSTTPQAAAVLQKPARTDGALSPWELSPQARQTAFWAGAVLTGANIIYLIGFSFYAIAGFEGLPPAATRLLASLSVLFGAPPLVVLFAALVSKANPLARLALVFATGFTLLAIANRISQILILAGTGDLSAFDLYTPGSLAQIMEFIAFGPLQGLALLFGSKLFPTGGLSGWTRRLFSLAGLFTLVGGTVFILLQTTVSFIGIPPVVGLLICLPAWVILYPAGATAATILCSPARRN